MAGTQAATQRFYKPSSPDDILAARRARSREAVQPLVDQLAVSQVAKESVGVMYDTDGNPTETVRRLNVFLQFARDNGHTAEKARDAKQLAAHGIALMALYARAHGIAGGRDTELYDYYDRDPTLSQDWIMLRRAIARGDATESLKRIMRQIGFVSASILTALCHDWFYGDGKPREKANGRREAAWRGVVRGACKAHGRNLSTSNEETVMVWEALMNLKHAEW